MATPGGEASKVQGNLQFYKRRKKKWKLYFFKITSRVYFHYFADQCLSKRKGEVLLGSIKAVLIPSSPPKGGQYVFEVQSKKGTWILSASTDDERQRWMESISPGSTSQYTQMYTRSRAATTGHIQRIPEVDSDIDDCKYNPQYVSPASAPAVVAVDPSGTPYYSSSNHQRLNTRHSHGSLPASLIHAATQNYSHTYKLATPSGTDDTVDSPYTDRDGYEIMTSPTATYPASNLDSELTLSTGTGIQAKKESEEQHKMLVEHYHKISFSTLTNMTRIGKGNFGEVFKADYTPREGGNSIEVAVKTLSCEHSVQAQKEMLKEFATMASMVHPNIVRLYGVVEDSVNPRIVIEYLPYGDLKTYLKRSPTKSVGRLVRYMVDVAMGMHYIAQKGLIHRDLAARNVLVGEGELCKVADFGLVRELPPDRGVYESQTQVPLPIKWMPPEAILDRKFSEASDVWSYGVLQWEMFNPHGPPYGLMNNSQVVAHVISGNRLSVPAECPTVVANVMQNCWHREPEKRPSFLQIATLLQRVT